MATVLFVLWNVVARNEGGANLITLLLNSVLGLLTAWAVLRLILDIVGASALRPRALPAPFQLTSPDCARQGSLITMCAWTKRVKDGGQWVSIEEFLDRHLQIVVSHGVSDELKAGWIAPHGVADVPEPSSGRRSMPPASARVPRISTCDGGPGPAIGVCLLRCALKRTVAQEAWAPVSCCHRTTRALACPRSRSKSAHQRTTPCIFETQLPPCRVRNASDLP